MTFLPVEETVDTQLDLTENDVVQSGLWALSYILKSTPVNHLLPKHYFSGVDATCPSSLPVYKNPKLSSLNGPPRAIGTCQAERCNYYRGFCSLGVAVAITGRLVVKEGLKIQEPCDIRNSCRWYAENGKASCQMCPHITRLPIRDQQKENGK